MKPGKVLKDLMLGLIYPAVLGTVMYSVLQVMADPLVVRLGFSASIPTEPSDPLVKIKVCLLLVTVLFYCFDYLYIMFTRNFNWLFFFCDIAFLVTLHVTVSAIGLGRPYPPQVLAILCCYTIFIVVYLIWDGYELWRCRTGHEVEGERAFYHGVIVWEVLSLIGLGLGLWLLDESLADAQIMLGTIAVVTGFFGYFALRKRKFMADSAAHNTAAQADDCAAA